MIRAGVLNSDTREAVGQALAVLVGGVLEETIKIFGLVTVGPQHKTIGGEITHAGALVVWRKVCLQVWHWMFMAFSFCSYSKVSVMYDKGGKMVLFPNAQSSFET